MYTQQTHYFLGANSPQGFYSLYDELMDLKTGDTVYILKGGPGCGKSSFMKKIADEMIQNGLEVEYIECTGDPDSLDAIVIPALKTAYVDGTAPHVIEPKYPAVVEQYINLGEFYDIEPLKKQKETVIELNQAYKALYVRAYDCIAAAYGVVRQLSDLVVDEAVIETVHKRGKGIIAREIPKNKKGKQEGGQLRRFLDSFTCKGHIFRQETVSALAKRVYVLDNSLGLADVLITDIAVAAKEAGYDAILCPSPLAPETLEHIIIPELSLAFVSRNQYMDYEGEHYRHIRLDAMTEGEKLRACKARIRFSRKMFNILMQEAEDTLRDAKALHDELEAVFNPHVDFDGVYDLAESHVRELLTKNKKRP